MSMWAFIRRRFLALLVDYLVILGWMGLIGMVSFVVFRVWLGGYPDYLGMFGPYVTQALFFTILTLPIAIYLYTTESGLQAATFGKRVVGLAVKDQSGIGATRHQIARRTIVKLLPWEIAHTFIWQLMNFFYHHGYETDPPFWILVGLIGAMMLAVVYVLMVFIRHDGRGPHDLVAGTTVFSSK